MGSTPTGAHLVAAGHALTVHTCSRVPEWISAGGARASACAPDQAAAEQRSARVESRWAGHPLQSLPG